MMKCYKATILNVDHACRTASGSKEWNAVNITFGVGLNPPRRYRFNFAGQEVVNALKNVLGDNFTGNVSKDLSACLGRNCVIVVRQSKTSLSVSQILAP